MDKLITLAGYDTGSGPHIFPIEPDRERTIGLIKMARPLPPRVEQYIRTAAPIAGRTQLLIDALGAQEYWGTNSNGDSFPEEALMHDGPDYGFRTFEHYAYPYKHHVNKDPARAFGEKVTLSEYDPHMHRVLLIVQVHNDKCHDILNDISNGQYASVSMGCRVPWDECSICKNRARNRSEYCQHLRLQMNKIFQDGRRVSAINRLPKFFDISFVMVGAEKASHVLKKVASATPGRPFEVMSSAEAGEQLYRKTAATVKASADKTADIDKEVPNNGTTLIRTLDQASKDELADFMDGAGEAKCEEPQVPPEVLDNLAEFPLSEVFTTLAAMGIDLRPHEFQRIVLVKLGHAKLAAQLEERRLVFNEARPGNSTPAWASGITSFDVERVNEKVAMIVRPLLTARSCYPEALVDRIDRLCKQSSETSDIVYNRNSQWHPMDDEAKRKSSGMSGLLPASLALATGFMMFKKLFPQIADNGPLPIRMLARHPWLLPILMSVGVGAAVHSATMSADRPYRHGTGSGLDAMGGSVYDGTKTASIDLPLARFGMIPLAYLYAGVQQKRWERGERLSAVDRFIASRPDLASIASVILAPRVAGGIRRLVKQGSLPTDMALYAVGTTSKLMPAVLAGAMVDSLVFRGIQRLLSRRNQKGSDNAHVR